jgi:hypothetical protein
MPKEDRRIFFDYEEVYKALYALCIQKQAPKPPPGVIVAIREDATDATKIYIDLENPQEKTKANREYTRDFLAAALMIFCRGLGIPLPKAATKSVVIQDGQVVLRVQI